MVKLSDFIRDKDKLCMTLFIDGMEGHRKLRQGIQRVALTFLSHFAKDHLEYIQAVGCTEVAYLEGLSIKNRNIFLDRFGQEKPPCVVFCHGTKIPKDFESCLRENKITTLLTSIETRQFIGKTTTWMSESFAQKATRHGTLLDVYGVGILLLGHSGIGKSECALDLIERGHRLVSDDAVVLVGFSDFIIGKSREHLPFHIEIRGLGIVNIEDLYGVKAVRNQKRIDFVIKFSTEEKITNRIDSFSEKYQIFDIELPCITIDIQAGKNLSILVEAAATIFRLKKMGRDPYKSLQKKMDEYLCINEKQERKEV